MAGYSQQYSTGYSNGQTPAYSHYTTKNFTYGGSYTAGGYTAAGYTAGKDTTYTTTTTTNQEATGFGEYQNHEGYGGHFTTSFDSYAPYPDQHGGRGGGRGRRGGGGPMRWRGSRGRGRGANPSHPYTPTNFQRKPPNIQPKNAINLLNEINPGLDYEIVKVEESGDDAVGGFRCSIKLNDMEYNATGSSKKEARRLVAEKALRGQIHLKNNAIYKKLANKILLANPGQTEASDEQVLSLIDVNQSAPMQPDNKNNPVMYLNQKLGGVVEYQVIEDGSNTNGLLNISVTPAPGMTFTGIGYTEQAAKSDAARKALYNLYNVTTLPTPQKQQKISVMKEDVSLLQDLYDHYLQWVVVQEEGGLGAPEEKKVIMKVIINGVEFEGVGKNKKAAKGHAAKTALAHLHGLLTDRSATEINGVSLYKNPVKLLHEYQGPNLTYDVVTNSAGLLNEFTATVRVGGQSFSGTASNKRLAKGIASIEALKQMYGVDIPASAITGKGSTELASSVNVEQAQRNPCNVLNHLINKKVEYTSVKEANEFVSTIVVKNKSYKGKGLTKKESRNEVARVALRQEFNILVELRPEIVVDPPAPGTQPVVEDKMETTTNTSA